MKLITMVMGCIVCISASTVAEEPKSNLPEQVMKLLNSVEGMTVYRIVERDVPAKDAKFFHGYEIIAQAEINEKTVRSEIVDVLKKGTSGDYAVAQCFNPGYGLRMTQGNTTYDFLICFWCGHLHIFTKPDADEKLEETISETALVPFQAVLKKAKIVLGDDEKEAKE
jgi:hypothetical protein